MNKATANELLAKYPNWMPLKVAAPILGVSPRQLSALIAAGREPYCCIGANIGIKQNYTRIYTGRLIQYICGEDME